MLEFLASSSISNVGLDKFLQDVLHNLTDFYNTQYAFVGELLPCGKRVRTLSVRAGGQVVDNFEYDLSGTPCKDILDLKVELVPRNASKLYAGDKMLLDMGVESYFGAPLLAQDGTMMGLISVMDTRPMELEEWSEPLLAVFASRMAQEFKQLKTNQLLRESEDKLYHSQKMDALGKLTGGIAHDYNNMLGIILGYAELLEDNLSDFPDLQKYSQEILRAGKRGAKLTKKLLSFSRDTSSGPSQQININKLLQEEQHMLEKTLTVRILLTLDLEDDLWPVWLNYSEFEDAIINISINAMHAIQQNGTFIIKTANVEIEQQEAQQLNLSTGQYVVLSLKDNGCGMDEETQSHIFDPYYTTKGELGSGLGLSQVFGFVQRCKGTIEVKSVLEQGTIMTLYFPRYEPESINNNKNHGEDKSLKGDETTVVVE